ncbi:hypothetical protein MKW94_013895 [Papaver nudicaule]|uniref:Uncharacterized protein n=1 Tax=Papaver nudicaule TaxID=74823 RepID=A0AA41SC39_PAPNU|nr:hypothetical protein [Papaver nudicaule]
MTSVTDNHSESNLMWRRKKGIRKKSKSSSSSSSEEEMSMEEMKASPILIINGGIKKTKKRNMKKNQNNKSYELLAYRDLPDYMKDNEYILDHYRANWPLKPAFYSLFRWHNETLNIWTWSLPMTAPGGNASHNSKDFFSRTTASVDLGQMSPSELQVAQWPFFIFLAGSMFCFLTSSTCHLFCCHSHRLNLLLLRMDYVGIAVMIVTSFFPPMYYIFQCQPQWQWIYLGGITAMGVFTIINLLTPAFSTSKYRVYRALLFFAMGFSGIIPAIHALILNWNEPERVATVTYESIMALSYAVGTLFYVTRIPERWKPGWFDLAGHSHQIFHIFVIMGALSHYYAALVFIDWRRVVGCTTP